MKIKTFHVDDEPIDIEVSGSGTFEAEFEDQSYTAKTLEQLEADLTKIVRKAKKAKPIPVSVVDLVPNEKRNGWETGAFKDGRGVVHAILRGQHARQNQYLLRVDDKDATKFQLSTYSSQGAAKIVRRLTENEVADYARLAGEADGAAKALEDWVEARRFDVDKALGKR